jgi:hypothetical protein
MTNGSPTASEIHVWQVLPGDTIQINDRCFAWYAVPDEAFPTFADGLATVYITSCDGLHDPQHGYGGCMNTTNSNGGISKGVPAPSAHLICLRVCY